VTDIAAVLREHDDYMFDVDSDGILCRGCHARCDTDSHATFPAALAAHQAEKVWEALRADAREEWGVRVTNLEFADSGDVDRCRDEVTARRWVGKRLATDAGYLDPGFEPVRRYVTTTDWETA
jgi:hypothetical protein